MCSSCKQWKEAANQKWSAQHVRDHQRRGDNLQCTTCKAAGIPKGQTENSKCEACFCHLPRVACGTNALKDKNKTRKPKDPPYILVCMKCNQREENLIRRLMTANAQLCNCLCGKIRHEQGCEWPRKHADLDADDLKFLGFRPKNVERFHL